MRLLRRMPRAMQINGADSTKIAVWVGDKHSNARPKPAFHKLVVANLPNNPPRWPEVAEVVRKILYAYKQNTKDWELMGEWIASARPRFFELTGFAFTKHHLDICTGARKTMNMSAHVHFWAGKKGAFAIAVHEGPYTHQAPTRPTISRRPRWKGARDHPRLLLPRRRQ